MSSASAANTAARSTAYTTPTAVLPLWFDRSRAASPLAFFTVAVAPTWNVNAPSTGWVSAEITRQVTT